MFKFIDTPTVRPPGWLTYAVALRAIGQDLTGLWIEFLEIVVQDDGFVARGRECKQSSREPFMRRYSAADIQRLDEVD